MGDSFKSKGKKEKEGQLKGKMLLLPHVEQRKIQKQRVGFQGQKGQEWTQ